MSDIFVQRGKLKEAEELLLESLELGKQIQHIDGIAFRTVKLGQISQARGDKETALARYRDGLAIFERIGMPEANQVRGLSPILKATETDDNPIAQAITQARTSAQRGDVEAAIKISGASGRTCQGSRAGTRSTGHVERCAIQPRWIL